MNTSSTTESCWACRPRPVTCPILQTSPGFSQFTGGAFAGGSAIVGYNFGQVTPYVITGVDFVRSTRFSSGAFNPSDAINTVFSGPGAVQAVGTFGVGVNYRITSNFSMGLEAIVHTNHRRHVCAMAVAGLSPSDAPCAAPAPTRSPSLNDPHA